jgi:putative tryptophan/tyrosine transport system substrate-binding protein
MINPRKITPAWRRNPDFLNIGRPRFHLGPIPKQMPVKMDLSPTRGHALFAGKADTIWESMPLPVPRVQQIWCLLDGGGMRRRDFIKALGAGAAAWPLAAQAQRMATPVIGYLAAGNPNSEARLVDAFIKGLGAAGYENGKNAKIEYRWAENQYDRLPSMATDLVRQEVAVIAATTTPAVRAAKAATGTIPIVFTTIADPVQIGFVASLNRPGGNVTGATMLSVEVGPKLLELLYGAVPSAKTMALLVNPTNPNAETQAKNIQQAAAKLGLNLQVLNASTESDLDPAFAKSAELQAGALIIGHDVFFNAQAKQLAAMTVRNKIPAIYTLSEFAAAGGLISYGASRSETWHQAGIYVGRILKGEKPAELPVIQPTTFEMAINLKTAKALGVSIPLTLIARADEIIE